jgi:hypothetical protein
MIPSIFPYNAHTGYYVSDFSEHFPQRSYATSFNARLQYAKQSIIQAVMALRHRIVAHLHASAAYALRTSAA